MNIDLQHQGLFELANRMHTAHMSGQALPVAVEIANELIDYAYEHFQTEEAYMLGIGYTKFDEHVRKHRSVENRIVELTEVLEQGADKQGELYRFLTNYLSKHILQSDFKFAHEFKRKTQTFEAIRMPGQ